MEATLTILNNEGLHARPAAILVKKASSFSGNIQIKTDGKEANAKSLMSVMSLGLKKDAQMTIVADGDQASEAIEQITELVNNKFGL